MCIRHLHRLTEEFDTETSALGRLNCSAVLASSWSPRNKMACFVLFWNSELAITFLLKRQLFQYLYEETCTSGTQT